MLVRDGGELTAGWCETGEDKNTHAERRLQQFFWLVRAARDLEKLCSKSHVYTISATLFFWPSLCWGFLGLEPLSILAKIL